MKFVAQRVSRASLTVDHKPVSEIGRGLVVYFGVKAGDGEDQAKKCAEKIAHLRVFEDDAGKMNLSVKEVAGEVLFVSQFTLYGDAKRATVPRLSRQSARNAPMNSIALPQNGSGNRAFPSVSACSARIWSSNRSMTDL